MRCQAGGGADHHGPIHPIRTRSERTPQPSGAEGEGPGEAVGQIRAGTRSAGPITPGELFDQPVDLAPSPWIRIGIAPGRSQLDQLRQVDVIHEVNLSPDRGLIGPV
jgi:hypothetical protein